MSIRNMIQKTGVTCDIQVVTRSPDDVGSWTEAWATVDTYSAVPVRIRLLSGDENENTDKKTVSATHKAYVEGALTGVDESCRVVSGGVTYRILLIDDWNMVGKYTAIWLERVS